ncbi:MAG: NAD-binding protein [Myxococcales bacterium]|nr:NAD-binding protein [Myxococcales bacterium]
MPVSDSSAEHPAGDSAPMAGEFSSAGRSALGTGALPVAPPSSRAEPGSSRTSPRLRQLIRSSWLDRLRASKPVGWRGGLLLLTFVAAFIALSSGVELTDRPGVSSAGVLTRLYYAIGLFVLGGLDLGMPRGGPAWGQDLLWLVYFVAPAITASAVIEGVLKVLEPQSWRLRRLRGHVVISGSSRLAMLYLKRLRKLEPRVPVVVVDPRIGESLSDQAREIYRAEIVQGDISSSAVLARIRLDRAARVVLLSDNDFSNLDAATRVLNLAPGLEGRIIVHVSDLRFMLGMAHTLVARTCATFNAHQIAARHLVETRMLKHFKQTLPRDRVVLAGFGRFGQTVLEELQQRAPKSFDRCLIVDTNAERACSEFAEQVGFTEGYERSVVEGDIKDPRLWRGLEESHQLSLCQPVIIVGSGDDATNLRAAIWLKQRWPSALVIARSFRASLFAEEVSRESGFEMVSVADLLLASMPESWFAVRGESQRDLAA